VPIHVALDEHIGSVSLPPSHLASDPTIKAAIDAYEDAKASYRQASSDAIHAQQRLREEAVRRDADALADAIERGKADPGQQHTREIDEQIEDLQRRGEASRIVMERRLTELRDVLADESDEWVASLATRRAEAAEALHSAIDTVTEAYNAVNAVESLERFARLGRYWTPPTLAPYIGRPPEIGVDGALAVLRAVAPVPPVQLEAEHVA
jgi:hypothetical protein